jgi:organic radical activating enzyme
MHIADMLIRRPIPAAGVFLALTRRCPLTCAHCSTNSMLDSEEREASIFSDFAATFTAEDHPEFVWLTGGEPLLRPDLVHQVTASAHAVGAQVALITGLYFARPDGRIPHRLLDAMLSVDHVVASQDVFHEMQVPRAAAFATMGTLLAAGQDISFQVVGRGADDPYLKDVTDDIRRTFGNRVPALVAPLGAVGRARSLLPKRPAAHTAYRDQQAEPSPCTVAAWPVVGFSGNVVACCQQNVVDGPAPAHLRLGTAPRQTWPQVAAAARYRPVLRVLRTHGPEVLASLSGLPPGSDYCGTCATLSSTRTSTVMSAVDKTATSMTEGPTFGAVESEVVRLQLAGGAEGFARRYGIPRYAEMLVLGHSQPATVG